MNRRHLHPQAASTSRTEATTWALGQQVALPVHRSRRLKRQLLDYRADFLLSGFMLVLLVWMALVALTLWH